VHRAALLLAVALALAACGDRGGGAGSPDVAGEWEFAGGTAAGADLPRPGGARATLDLTGEEARGTAFCNQYFSAYRLEGSTIALEEIASTQMACEPDVMTAESAFLAALGDVDGVAVDGADLLLTGDGVELRFSPVAPVPDSPLEGTRWVLETLIDDLSASSTVGDPAVLTLDGDRHATAGTGCSTVTGTWLVEDGSLVIDDLLADGATCPPDVERQDAAVQSVLQSGPTLEIEEDRLTLTAADGQALVYRAG